MRCPAQLALVCIVGLGAFFDSAVGFLLGNSHAVARRGLGLTWNGGKESAKCNVLRVEPKEQSTQLKSTDTSGSRSYRGLQMSARSFETSATADEYEVGGCIATARVSCCRRGCSPQAPVRFNRRAF